MTRRSYFLFGGAAALLLVGASTGAWFGSRANLMGAKSQPQATLTAAVLALFGTLIAAMIALVGYVLKQAVDRGNLEVARAAEQRAQVDQERLRMETAIATVQVLATSDGKASPPAQSSAALIVLSRLSELELALNLAAELWPAGGVSTSAVVSICDQAFEGSVSVLHRLAASLLYNNWQRLSSKDHPEQVYWPSALVDGWPSHIDGVAKSILEQLLREWTADFMGSSKDDFRHRLLNQA